MSITPTAKYINRNYTLEDWVNDYLFVPWIQWSHCELDLIHDSIYYWLPDVPTLTEAP